MLKIKFVIFVIYIRNVDFQLCITLICMFIQWWNMNDTWSQCDLWFFIRNTKSNRKDEFNIKIQHIFSNDFGWSPIIELKWTIFVQLYNCMTYSKLRFTKQRKSIVNNWKAYDSDVKIWTSNRHTYYYEIYYHNILFAFFIIFSSNAHHTNILLFFPITY